MGHRFVDSWKMLGAWLAVVVLASGAARAEVDAREVLERSVAGYAAMEELAGRLDFSITLPDGTTQDKRLAFGRLGRSAFQALLMPDGSRGLEIVATGDRLYAAQFNVPNAYVEAPYEGDLPAALESIGAGPVGLELAAPLAAAMTADTGAFLKALGFGVLGPLEARGVEKVMEDGGDYWSVELVADNGTCTALFDPFSHRLTAFRAVIGQGEHQIRGAGTFVETPTSELAAEVGFDPRSRQAVADFAALEASAYPLGQPAPPATARDLDGAEVALADLLGHVVVLDFWATWCVPCWSSLEEAEKLAEWAESSGSPVVVIALNTLESGGYEQQKKAAAAFLKDRGLALQTWIDADDSFFRALHTPGLPSTVVIGPDGTLARYHSGVLPDMAAQLQREAEELLAAAGS